MPSDKDNGSNKIWTPAVLIKRPDNIISSDYTRANKIFVPSYEIKECRPCMDHLIANEYQRIWWEERDAWDKCPDGKRGKCDSGPPKVKKREIKSLKAPNKTTFRDNKAQTMRMKEKEAKAAEEAASTVNGEKSGSTRKKRAKP